MPKSIEKEKSGVAAPPAEAKPKPKQQPRDQSDSKPRQQPPYAVILHNDSINGFDYVVATLRKVFHYGGLKAFRLTFTAHVKGRVVVWSGMKEHAELKADQLRSCGPDPQMKARGAQTLRVTIEPQT